MLVRENTTFTKDYFEADKRHIGNAVQVFFKDGTFTPRISVDVPIGHRKRRAAGIPVLIKKFESSVADHFPPRQAEAIKAQCSDRAKVSAMSVSEFLATWVKN